MTSNAKADLWLANEISQSLCKVFSSIAINPKTAISFMFFQHVLPRFCLKQRKDENWSVLQLKTAVCCVVPWDREEPVYNHSEQGSIPPVQHSHFLLCWTSGKRKKTTENGPIWGAAILYPPSSSASGAWIYGTPNSRFRRAF